MKYLLYLLAFVPSILFAQVKDYTLESSSAFAHMEVGGVVGSTGLGLDIAVPLSNNFKLRAGFSAMPNISNVASYSMTAAGGSSKIDINHRVENLVGYLRDFVNNDQVDKYVDMSRKVGFYNAKAILDWYPFKKKNWHFSAGLYVGSSHIGEMCNTQEEAPTMLAMLLYNDMYEQIRDLDEYEYPTFSLGKFSFEMDPITGKYIKRAFKEYGRVAVQLGTSSEGNAFYVTPDVNGVLKADVETNVFKPYIGFGYNKHVGKEKRWNVGFDAGVMFWGTPHVYCDGFTLDSDDNIENRERVCLVHDVKNISGVAGKYIKFVRCIPVLPVLEVKLAYSIY